MTELGTACNAMSPCKELRDVDTTLELPVRVVHPMKMCRRKSCECWPSSVKKVSDYHFRNIISMDELVERLFLAYSYSGGEHKAQ